MAFDVLTLLLTLFSAWIVLKISQGLYNVFLHPLKTFPGPLAAQLTTWYKTYIEIVKQENMTDALFRLHKQYGDVVRMAPNELHFSNPSAYNDIYNNAAHWDKEQTMYESFGEDHSSFGFLDYATSKQRKDVLQPLFSRRAITGLQGLVRKKMDRLCDALIANNSKGKSSDLFSGFRCFTLDTITEYCFAKSVDAIDAPDFAAPIVLALEASPPTFLLFRHFPPFRKLIFSLPPWLALRASPDTAGLTNLQVLLGKQVEEVVRNPEILRDAPHPVIYHRLLDPEAHKGHPIPNATSLYEEAQTMMFAGTDTVGLTLMVGFFHIATQQDLYKKLQSEIRTVWPDNPNPPTFEEFEKLPVLTAAIKESLRFSPGVVSPALRIVPSTGATVSKKLIPGGTIVGVSSYFVHRSSEIFQDPDMFKVERWLDDEAQSLEKWLVPFSKGPRSCLGINLAWCELYISFATMLRRFDMEIDGITEKDLIWRDTFLPHYYSSHLRAWCRPVSD